MEKFNAVDLKNYSSMALAASGKQLWIIENLDDIEDLRNGLHMDSVLLLGEGTNTVFSEDYEGLILVNRLKGIQVTGKDSQNVSVSVAAGENWHGFVLWSLNQGFQGLENLSLIPGSVGAAPIQNIGAYGIEVENFIDYVKGFDLKTEEWKTFQNKECKFSYRNSLFKSKLRDRFLITEVGFKLNLDSSNLEFSYASLKDRLKEQGISKPNPRDISEAVIHIRSSKLPDPNEIGNSGSFFKNPIISSEEFQRLKKDYPEMGGFQTSDGFYKVYAGWLIEKIGWKGKDLGGLGVHSKQALVIINHGNGRGEEIKELAEKLEKEVLNKFGIKLEREVRII